MIRVDKQRGICFAKQVFTRGKQGHQINCREQSRLNAYDTICLLTTTILCSFQKKKKLLYYAEPHTSLNK
jgi:hypothetical protein